MVNDEVTSIPRPRFCASASHWIGAGELDRGSINPSVMLTQLRSLEQKQHTILDREVLLAFDSFAEANIHAGKPLAVCFCLVNATLAHLLMYLNLESQFIARLQEARAKFGIA